MKYSLGLLAVAAGVFAIQLASADHARATEWHWQLNDCNCPGPPNHSFRYGNRSGDIPVVGDWDYDANRTDTAGVFYNGHWQLRNSNTAGAPNIVYYFGQPGDLPQPSGWGVWIKDVPGIARPQSPWVQWHVNSGFQTTVFPWGVSTDTLRTAGRGNAVAIRGIGSVLRWYPRDTSYPYSSYVDFGAPGDHPVIGDWDGNGTETPGLYRQGTWFLKNTWSGSNSDSSFGYGSPGSFPVVGDWNGDGYDSVGVVD